MTQDLPPLYSVETERAFLQLALQEPACFDAADLTAADFHDAFLGTVFDAGREMFHAGTLPDFALLCAELERRGIERVTSRLSAVLLDDATPGHEGVYAAKLRDLADRRGALALIEQAGRDIFNRNGDWRDHVAAAGVDLAQVDEYGKAQPAGETPVIEDLSECPALPAAAQLDPALGVDASPWLDAYIGFSRQWAPRAFDGFHEAVGLWVLATVAARRVKLDFGGERFPSLYLANVARSSVWTKSTAHHIGSALLDAGGLSYLLAPDESTPQALLSRMALPATVTDWDAKTAEDRERDALALAFAGQKGWDFDEFGGKVSAMMRDSGSMADFRGLLRRFDDAPDKYVYATIGRGDNRLVRPYLAILASLTPADMQPYAKQGGALWHDGFWARFAFIAPAPEEKPNLGRFPEGQRVMPYDLLQPLRAWHERLGTPAVDVTQRKDGEGKPSRDFDVTVTPQPPELCNLARDVREMFYAYHDALTSIAAAGDNTDLDGNYSRFAEKALRVAMLLASIENRGNIEARHWARAQAIAERWRRSLHNLYRTLNLAGDDEARTEDRVIEIVARLKLATPVAVRRYAPNLSTSQAGAILERLTRAGALQVTTRNRKGSCVYAVVES
jgi:hypothetical protein